MTPQEQALMKSLLEITESIGRLKAEREQLQERVTYLEGILKQATVFKEVPTTGASK